MANSRKEFHRATWLGILRRERKKLLKQARRYDAIASELGLGLDVGNHLWNGIEQMDADIALVGVIEFLEDF